MPTGGGGGGGGGLSSVTTDATMTGAGTGGSPLSVAAPYNHAAPGTLGGTTSSTGQFTQVAVGTSPPSLPGTTGQVAIAGSVAIGPVAQPATAGDVSIARGAANSAGVINLGTGNRGIAIQGSTDAGSNATALVNQTVCGNVYTQTRHGIAFSSLPAAAASYEGSIAGINDSTTVVWGATITGGGTNHVLAYCDGTNWTVAAI